MNRGEYSNDTDTDTDTMVTEHLGLFIQGLEKGLGQ
jgi:hypothetical protein